MKSTDANATPRAFPLRVQRCGNDGWFFVACDDIPGLSVFGPDLNTLLRQIEVAGAELLRFRGNLHVELSVEAVPIISHDRVWADANQFELRKAS